MNKHGSKWIRVERRLGIYLRDSFTCVYCLRNLSQAPASQVTLDHVICRDAKGGNESTNLVVSCLPCNSSRGATPVEQFASAAALKRVFAAMARPVNLSLAKSLLAERREAA